MLIRTIAVAHSAVLVVAVLAALVVAPTEAAPAAGPGVAVPAPSAAPTTTAAPSPAPAAPVRRPPVAAPRAARPVQAAPAPVRRRPVHSHPVRTTSVSHRPGRATPGRAPAVVAAPAPPRTARQRLDSAVSRIPGYRTHPSSWELTDRYGSWGVADWNTDRIYISPRVPTRRLFDVVAHEWSHLRSVDAYGGDVRTAAAEMNRWFGGTGLRGAELAADCMARQLGATWTSYTSCTSAHDREGAAALLEGRRLG